MRDLFLLPVLATVLAACGSGQVPLAAATVQEAPARSRCLTEHRVIVGVDETGSYARTSTALEQVATLIETSACPRDEWFLRWIRADSYPPDAAIRTDQFLVVAERPAAPANTLDGRKYRVELAAWLDSANRFAAQRREVGAKVRELVPSVAGATDIVGFLVKADELLANRPVGSEPWVVVATDMLHNSGPEPPFQLHEAGVLVIAFEGEDVEQGPLVRATWQERFTAAGASAVYWRDATEPLVESLDALASGPSPGGS